MWIRKKKKPIRKVVIASHYEDANLDVICLLILNYWLKKSNLWPKFCKLVGTLWEFYKYPQPMRVKQMGPAASAFNPQGYSQYGQYPCALHDKIRYITTKFKYNNLYLFTSQMGSRAPNPPVPNSKQWVKKSLKKLQLYIIFLPHKYRVSSHPNKA